MEREDSDLPAESRHLKAGDLPLGVSILSIDSPDYPENLRQISDPPQTIFIRGRMEPMDRVSVAIVGTRKPTPLGREIAYQLAKDLASSGVTIVSGLALGIDSQAHRGALDAGGRTIACLGTGVDIVYPPSNVRLFQEVLEKGCLVSEYPLGQAARPWHFPERNRIISGLALGVVVVEAGEKSGALITCDWALKQGKPVMAVPGSPKSWASQGTNKLIQDGAYLVTSYEDVLSFLGQEGEYVPEIHTEEKRSGLTLEEQYLMDVITEGPADLDEIMKKIESIPVSRAISILGSLELKGAIIFLAGGKIVAR